MSSSDLVENCVAASYHVAERIPGKWSNIQSISVKSTNSVSLPFYTVTPKELLQLFPRKGDTHNQSSKNNVDQEEKPKEENEVDIGPSVSKNPRLVMTSKKLKNSLTLKTTTIGDDDKDNKKKTKAVTKSPLLVALKKQKEQQGTSERDNGNTLTIANERSSSVSASESTKKIKGVKRKEIVANTTATITNPSATSANSTQNKKKKKIDSLHLNMKDDEDNKKEKKRTKNKDVNKKADRNGLKNTKVK